ncbi:hypothetical protein AKO1_003657, partial [Acrasis kona]
MKKFESLDEEQCELFSNRAKKIIQVHEKPLIVESLDKMDAVNVIGSVGVVDTSGMRDVDETISSMDDSEEVNRQTDSNENTVTNVAVKELGFVLNHKSPQGSKEAFYTLLKRRDYKVFKCNYAMHHPNGGIIAELSKNIFTKEMMQVLYNSTLLLAEALPPQSGEEEVKNVKAVHHIGSWRKYQKFVFTTSETKNEHSQKWLEQNDKSGLFSTITDYVKKKMPHLFEAYKCANNNEISKFAPFNCVAINYGTTSRHMDEADPEFGHAFVVPFGEFSRAELILDNVLTGFDAEAGDLVHFDAANIYHYNQNVVGDRFSLVFFTDKNSFFNAISTLPRKRSDPLQNALRPNPKKI